MIDRTVETVTPMQVHPGDRVIGLDPVIDMITFTAGKWTLWADDCPLISLDSDATVQVIRGNEP